MLQKILAEQMHADGIKETGLAVTRWKESKALPFIHESNLIEGIAHVDANDITAFKNFIIERELSVESFKEAVYLLQAGARLRDDDNPVEVKIKGKGHLPPPPGRHVSNELHGIAQKANRLKALRLELFHEELEDKNVDRAKTHLNASVLELYLSYGMLHPFSDANGRSGRLMVAWILGPMNETFLEWLHYAAFDIKSVDLGSQTVAGLKYDAEAS